MEKLFGAQRAEAQSFEARRLSAQPRGHSRTVHRPGNGPMVIEDAEEEELNQSEAAERAFLERQLSVKQTSQTPRYASIKGKFHGSEASQKAMNILNPFARGPRGEEEGQALASSIRLPRNTATAGHARGKTFNFAFPPAGNKLTIDLDDSIDVQKENVLELDSDSG